MPEVTSAPAAAPTEHLCAPMDGEAQVMGGAAYRAFLLYGMMDPNNRSQRAVARTVGVSEGTVRNWRERFAWKARTSRDDAERICAAHYWRKYNDTHADAEVRQIAKDMRVPYIQPVVDRPRVVFDSGQQVEDVVNIAREAEAAKSTKRRELLSRLADRMMLGIAEDVKNGKIRYSVGDLEKLLRVTHMLQGLSPEGEEHGAARGRTAGMILEHLESVRVKLARATGDRDTLLRAALEDAEEQALILRHLLKPAIEHDPDAAGALDITASA